VKRAFVAVILFFFVLSAYGQQVRTGMSREDRARAQQLLDAARAERERLSGQAGNDGKVAAKDEKVAGDEEKADRVDEGNGTEYEMTLRDTLSSFIVYPLDRCDKIYIDYLDNSERMHRIREEVEQRRADGYEVTRLDLVGAASPEGGLEHNQWLSVERAARAKEYLRDWLDLRPSTLITEAIGENWPGLEEVLLEKYETPWRDSVLDLMTDEDGRKDRLKRMEQGTIWKDLLREDFPWLRSARFSLVMEKNICLPLVQHDTVYVDRPVEVLVAVPCDTIVPVKKLDLSGRKMIFAIRTNFAMIPLTNIGIEIPIGEHFSIGADWYSPWIWREHQNWGLNSVAPDKDRDSRGWCFEFQAADVEVRYWFKNTRKLPEQRLLGHSIGIYGAMGHYDFERNWTGYQGEFWNVGLDYLYAWPICRGKLHMEVELGLGFIHSMNTPYECLVQGDVCYRIPGPRRAVDWFGPTRVQFSLVLPIYVKTGKHN
jgi:hypothetical protein